MSVTSTVVASVGGDRSSSVYGGGVSDGSGVDDGSGVNNRGRMAKGSRVRESRKGSGVMSIVVY